MTLPPVDQIIRSRRKTIAILVKPDGRVIVRAPLGLASEKIRAWIETKAAWIAAKKAEMQQHQQQAARHERRYAEGETFPFLGQEYPLRLEDGSRRGLRFERGFLLHPADQPQAAGLFEAWYKAAARELLSQRVRWFARVFGLTYRKIRISSARTRWGSCSTSGTLSFNWRLVMAPPEVVDYVVVHELAHLRQPNHSPAFWDEVAKMMPDYALHRDWLKKNGRRLHL